MKKIVPALLALGLITAAAPLSAEEAPGAPPGSGVVPPVPRDPNTPPPIQGQNVNGMRVYLRAGLKTHGAGQHDYPQFLADWSKVLTEHGAVVDGSYHAPSAQELEKTDVVVMYKGDAGYMNAAEKAALDAFVRRGGGIVILHDALCGPNPAEFAKYVGAGKKHGEVNYTLETDVNYVIVDKASPIMKGVTTLSIPDEAFYKLTWATEGTIRHLATNVISNTPAAQRGGGVGQTVPQIWTYEHTVPGGQPARAFVWMQGHTYENFSKPDLQAMLLRGIAWAGKHPVDELVDYKLPVRPQRQGGANPG
jgi:type 1 glutamine amidotransferase